MSVIHNDQAPKKSTKRLEHYLRYQERVQAHQRQREEAAAPKYRNRAKERRERGSDEAADDTDITAFIDAEHSKFLGGDLEHTHLVQGLDYQLLAKVRAQGGILRPDGAQDELEYADVVPIDDDTTLEAAYQTSAAEEQLNQALLRSGKATMTEETMVFRSAWARQLYRTVVSDPLRDSEENRKRLRASFVKGHRRFALNVSPYTMIGTKTNRQLDAPSLVIRHVERDATHVSDIPNEEAQMSSNSAMSSEILEQIRKWKAREARLAAASMAIAAKPDAFALTTTHPKHDPISVKGSTASDELVSPATISNPADNPADDMFDMFGGEISKETYVPSYLRESSPSASGLASSPLSSSSEEATRLINLYDTSAPLPTEALASSTKDSSRTTLTSRRSEDTGDVYEEIVGDKSSKTEIKIGFGLKLSSDADAYEELFPSYYSGARLTRDDIRGLKESATEAPTSRFGAMTDADRAKLESRKLDREVKQYLLSSEKRSGGSAAGTEDERSIKRAKILGLRR